MQNALRRELNGGIVIKYSDDSQLTESAVMKLRGAIDAARRAVDETVSVLWGMLQAPTLNLASIGELAYKTLRMHFRLEHPTRNTTTQATEWNTWRADIRQLARNYRTLHNGIMKRPLTIADAYASTVGREVRQQLAAFDREHDTKALVAAILDGGRDERRLKAKLEGMVKAAGIGGVVSPKRATIARMSPVELDKHVANDLTVSMTADEQGSIKLNFPLLLRDDGTSIVSVARTLIHEASHKFFYTRDFGYAGREEYFAMSKTEAMMNADSYAYAAISLYKHRLFVTPEDVRGAPKGINMNA